MGFDQLSPELEVMSIKELQTEAGRILLSERDAIIRLVRSYVPRSQMNVLLVVDKIYDEVTEYILTSADHANLLNFIRSKNFRSKIYRYRLVDALRGLKVSADVNQIEIAQPPVEMIDRVENLTAEFEGELAEEKPVDQERIRNFLFVTSQYMGGATLKKIGAELGVSEARVSNIYTKGKEKFPWVAARLPPFLSDLKAGSKYWGGPGHSQERMKDKIKEYERVVARLQELAKDIGDAKIILPEALVNIQRSKVLGVVKFFLGDISIDELNRIVTSHREITRIRKAIANALGYEDLPRAKGIRFTSRERAKEVKHKKL